VVSPTSLRDLRVSLSVQPNAGDVDALRDVAIDENKLTEILTKSNRGGLEPMNSTPTGVNTKIAEQPNLRTSSSSSGGK
jgi:hypothetical protein